MKFVMALCALLFAVQAEASTVRFDFEVRVTEEEFYTPRFWQAGDSSNNPGNQTVTYGNNPYGFHYKFSDIRDGGWHASVIEMETGSRITGYGINVKVTSCSLGGISCGTGDGSFTADSYLAIPSWFGGFGIGIENGGEAYYAYDGLFGCGTNPAGQTITCGLYAATLEVRIAKTPLPAGGALLVSSLLMMSLRSRFRRHPRQAQ